MDRDRCDGVRSRVVPGLKGRRGGAAAPDRHEWRRSWNPVLQHTSPQAPSRRLSAGTPEAAV